MKKKCKFCKEKKEVCFLIREKQFGVNIDSDFCSKQCFLNHIKKRYKLVRYN